MNQVKDMVRNFSKGNSNCAAVCVLLLLTKTRFAEVERIEKYANERLGVSKLLKSMRDIQRLQDSLHSNAFGGELGAREILDERQKIH